MLYGIFYGLFYAFLHQWKHEACQGFRDYWKIKNRPKKRVQKEPEVNKGYTQTSFLINFDPIQ
jgi:hypothetical protein